MGAEVVISDIVKRVVGSPVASKDLSGENRPESSLSGAGPRPFGSSFGAASQLGASIYGKTDEISEVQRISAVAALKDITELKNVDVTSLIALSKFLNKAVTDSDMRNNPLDFKNTDWNRSLRDHLVQAHNQLSLLRTANVTDASVSEALGDVSRLALQLNAIQKLPVSEFGGIANKVLTPEQIAREELDSKARAELLAAAGRKIGDLIVNLDRALPLIIGKVGDAKAN